MPAHCRRGPLISRIQIAGFIAPRAPVIYIHFGANWQSQMLLISMKIKSELQLFMELPKKRIQETYSNGSGCCIVVEHAVTVFGALTCNGAGVSGDRGTSSSGPDTSGRDFTRSFRKSNRLSDKIHCFLQIYKL